MGVLVEAMWRLESQKIELEVHIKELSIAQALHASSSQISMQ